MDLIEINPFSCKVYEAIVMIFHRYYFSTNILFDVKFIYVKMVLSEGKPEISYGL